MILALVIALSAQPTTDAKIRVYVSAAPGQAGYADQLLTDRQEAVTLVKKEMARKRTLTVVDTPANADVTLEILDSTKKNLGRERTTPAPIGLGTNTRQAKDYAIRGKLSVDDYALEIEGTHRQQKQAAGALADAVETWAKQNTQKLIVRRGRSQ